MKQLLLAGLLSLLTTTAIAGQVVILPVGQTMPLSNGDVVVCGQLQPTSVKCTLYISGITSFTATGDSEKDAKDRAYRACSANSVSRSFKDDWGNRPNLCDGQTYGATVFYSCK